MLRKNLKPFFLIVLMITAGFACNFQKLAVSKQSTSTPQTSDTSKSLEETISTAIANAGADGSLRLEITEAQMTTALEEKIQAHPEYKLSDPAVTLNSGQIKFTATTQQAGLTVPAELIMTVTPDSSGNLSFTVDSARVGPIPLPENLLVTLTAEINQAFSDQITAQAGDLKISSIEIADGKMIVEGTLR